MRPDLLGKVRDCANSGAYGTRVQKTAIPWDSLAAPVAKDDRPFRRSAETNGPDAASGGGRVQTEARAQGVLHDDDLDARKSPLIAAERLDE